ncbi:MAG TPA: PleD family two-component system response regulator [Rhodospirillaceae bacterium]|nr:MAG: PleD family two-component system response regulator [Alphaproteobacteria bacterium GWF2_58_20]HAU28803.1 PleD family two-component system response regulator [Rhodospirillaceae bacterium]
MPGLVLVVDDFPPNAKLLAVKLSNEYYDVIMAEDGFQALEKAQKEHPDIILLDVMMPRMDGFEVCRRLKANPETQSIPVVMVTALTETADRVRGLEAGADDFLSKPINDLPLFARVRSLIRLKMMMDQWRVRSQNPEQVSNAMLMAEVTTKARILVADELPGDLEKMKKFLEKDEHVLTFAGDPEEVLDILAREDFDATIISLTLPGDAGLRLCSRIRSREQTRQMPILLVADEGDLETPAKGLELGATDYILRPLDEHETLARVRTQVRRKRFQERLRTSLESSVNMAYNDPLTGVYNRRYFDMHLERMRSIQATTRKSFSLIMFDIDHFKLVNDTYGHGVGDEVLKEISSRVMRNVRNFDLLARIGGEEFMIILPDTPLETATAIAGRLRRIVADRKFRVSHDVKEITVTSSFGVTDACLAEAADILLKRVDSALYKAKDEGRDRVVVTPCAG